VARVCLAVAIATAHSLVMADPVQTLTDARDSAIAALDVADYTAARKAAVKALAVLATVPDGQTQAGGHTWNRGPSKISLHRWTDWNDWPQRLVMMTL